MGCGFGRAGFFCFPAVGIIGNAGVAAVASRAIDWVLMGPEIDLSFGMPDNALWLPLFKERGTFAALFLRTE